MAFETQNTPVAITAADEIAIKTAADTLIRAAAAKNGWTYEQVPIEARTDALNYARNSYIEEQARKANPVYAQLQAEREAHKLTQMQLDSLRQTRPGASGS